jgi:hypothetical protein
MNPEITALMKKLEPGLTLLTEEDSASAPGSNKIFIRFGIGPLLTLVVAPPGTYFTEGNTFIPTGREKDARYLATYARAWAFIQVTGLVGTSKPERS